MKKYYLQPQKFPDFEVERKRIVYFGLKTLSYRSPQLWSLLPEHMRQINSFDQFKRSVRQWVSNPAGNYMFKVTNKNTRARCEICSKLTIKTPERRHWRRSDVFIVNF